MERTASRDYAIRSLAVAKGLLLDRDKAARVRAFNAVQRKPSGTRTFDVPYTVIKAKPSGQVDGTNDITSNDVTATTAAPGCAAAH